MIFHSCVSFPEGTILSTEAHCDQVKMTEMSKGPNIKPLPQVHLSPDTAGQDGRPAPGSCRWLLLHNFKVSNLSGWWLTYPSEKWWSSSVGMMTFPIYGKIKNIPNHQSAIYRIYQLWGDCFDLCVFLLGCALVTAWAIPSNKLAHRLISKIKMETHPRSSKDEKTPAYIESNHVCTCCIVLYCVVFYCIVLYCIGLYCIVLYCVVLCCIVLCCVVLCCVVLYCIVLYCIVLYSIVLCCIVLFCVVLYCVVLCCIVLCCVVLCCVVLCCVVLYCIALCCIVLYCVVLCCIVLYACM